MSELSDAPLGIFGGTFDPVHLAQTKTSPMGSIDRPLSPVSVALAAGAGFVARSVDNDAKHLMGVFEAAAAFKGSAFIEVLQNCVIFNDGAHKGFYDPSVRKENVLYLQDGQPLLYGTESDKGLFHEGFAIGTGPVTDANRDKVLTHSTTEETGTLAWTLSQFDHPAKPVPLGIFRAVERPAYHELMDGQIAEARVQRGPGDLRKLLNTGITWKI